MTITKKVVPLIFLLSIATLVMFRSRISSTQESSSNVQHVKLITDASNPKKNNNLKVVRAHGDFYVPKDITDLIAKSDIIIVGRAMQSINESIPLVKRTPEGEVTEAISQTEFKVIHVIKGTVNKGDVIPVGQQAAVVKDTQTSKDFLQVLDEYQPLVKNSKYILFLAKGLNNSPLYFPVGVYFGKFNTDAGDQAETKNENVRFKEIKNTVLKNYKQVLDQVQ